MGLWKEVTSSFELKGQTANHLWQITISKDPDVHYLQTFWDGTQASQDV